MKFNILKLTMVIGFFTFAFSGSAFSQSDAEIEAMQSLARAQIKFIIIQELDLSSEENEVFWPVYDEYRAELSELGEQATELVNDYAATYQNMTNEVADDLITRYFAVEKARLEIRMEYREKMAEVLSPIKVAKFTQIENKLIAIAQYQLASLIPLMEEAVQASPAEE